MSKNRSYSKVLTDLSDLAPKEEEIRVVVSDEPIDEDPVVLEEVLEEEVEVVGDIPMEGEAVPTEEVVIPSKTAVDHTGATVIKPAVTTNVPVETYAQVNQPVEDANVLQLRQLIDVYLRFNSGDIVRTREDTERAGTLFRTTLKYVMDYPTTPVMDEMYRFFKTHRDRILAPKYVFPSIISMPKQMAERMSCIYTVFSMLVKGSESINVAMLRELLGKSFDAQKTEAFLLYFDQKTR